MQLGSRGSVAEVQAGWRLNGAAIGRGTGTPRYRLQLPVVSFLGLPLSYPLAIPVTELTSSAVGARRISCRSGLAPDRFGGQQRVLSVTCRIALAVWNSSAKTLLAGCTSLRNLQPGCASLRNEMFSLRTTRASSAGAWQHVSATMHPCHMPRSRSPILHRQHCRIPRILGDQPVARTWLLMPGMSARLRHASQVSCSPHLSPVSRACQRYRLLGILHQLNRMIRVVETCLRPPRGCVRCAWPLHLLFVLVSRYRCSRSIQGR